MTVNSLRAALTVFTIAASVLLGAAPGCICPTTKCGGAAALIFDVRGSGDRALNAATISGGAPGSRIVAVDAGNCGGSACTHRYFEPDGEGTRRFTITADGYEPGEIELALLRTSDGCQAVVQRVRVSLVPTASNGALAKSVQALGAACD